MKFRKDNQYSYGQDFSVFRGIPSGVDFKVERIGALDKNIFRLTAHGYGQVDPWDRNSYGNGALYVRGLTKRQRKRFEHDVNN